MIEMADVTKRYGSKVAVQDLSRSVPDGELFAFSFWPEQRDQWVAAVRHSFELYRAGLIKRGGSWEGYRIMGGATGPRVGLHRLYHQVFTNIRDHTDDFDTPAQFEKLRGLFEKGY